CGPPLHRVGRQQHEPGAGSARGGGASEAPGPHARRSELRGGVQVEIGRGDPGRWTMDDGPWTMDHGPSIVHRPSSVKEIAMSDQVGFVTMAGARATKEAPEVGVGMFGYAFMGKAHTNAYKKLPYMVYPPPAVPRLVAVAGRNEEGVREAAKRYGYEKYYTDWRQLIEDPEVQLFDNGGPNDMHAEPCIAAA